MGSFSWDNPCYLQYHNGRPLSVALTEPCQCNAETAPCIQSDFAFQYRPRSQSSGRRFQRESFSIYRPNVQYNSFCYSPPFSRRMMDHSSARDMLVEKLETVTIEEQQCRPNRCCTPYVCTPSPPIRQVKIRSRPSSCFDLNKKESTDNQWTKVVDERHEEHYDWHYNITLPLNNSVPIQRESSSTAIDERAVTKIIEDLHIPITSKLVRPPTRDVGTITDILPKKPIRPLSISETQVLDRYEKNEKIRRDSITDTASISYAVTQRPLHRSSDDDNDDDDDDSDEKEVKHASSKKAHRKEFVQRMHARNGTTALRSYNSMNIYSDWGKNQMIVRPTARPREALVDAPAIVAPPTESETSIPLTIETKYRSRNYFQPI